MNIFKHVIRIISIITFPVLAAADPVCSAPPSLDLLPKCHSNAKITRRGSIVSCYEPSYGFSLWSAAFLLPGQDRDYDRETCDWKTDQNVKSISPSAYTNSGFVKGHLIAFTDVSCPESAVETCTSSNIIPQPGVQNSGVWLGLEKHIRKKISTQKESHIMIVAGAYMKGEVTFIKPGLAKPSGIWKVFVNLDKRTGCGYLGTFVKPYKIESAKLKDLGFAGYEDDNESNCKYK